MERPELPSDDFQGINFSICDMCGRVSADDEDVILWKVIDGAVYCRSCQLFRELFTSNPREASPPT